MKVEKIDEKEFEPIELKIKIESMDELISLWYRFNIPGNTVIENTTSKKFKQCCIRHSEMFYVLEKELVRLGVK